MQRKLINNEPANSSVFFGNQEDFLMKLGITDPEIHEALLNYSIFLQNWQTRQPRSEVFQNHSPEQLLYGWVDAYQEYTPTISKQYNRFALLISISRRLVMNDINPLIVACIVKEALHPEFIYDDVLRDNLAMIDNLLNKPFYSDLKLVQAVINSFIECNGSIVELGNLLVKYLGTY
jgi:hypothetical protein